MQFCGPVMALDYGTRRIGVAISDPEGTFAFPADAVASRGRAQALEALQSLVSERDIQRIVVGHPLHLNGQKSETAVAAEEFANELAEKTGLPVELLDERWTTREAERVLNATKSGRRKRREVIDSAAATLLLQTWLERERNRASAEPEEAKSV